MKDTRISVMGAAGSGTSTVGRSVARALSLPHFESDDYFHGPSDPPYRNPRSARERFDMICRDMSPDRSWVLSGGIATWTPCPPLNFTGIVFLHVPTEIRMERLRQREQHRFGDRVQPGGDMYDQHREFLDWASRYDVGDVEGNTWARHRDWLERQTCPVQEISGAATAEQITDKVLRSLRRSGQIE